MAKKCCESIWPWVVLVVAALWLLGAVVPAFRARTVSIPWMQIIIIAAAIGWINCKK